MEIKPPKRNVLTQASNLKAYSLKRGDSMQLFLSLLTGFIVGLIFAIMKLPIPAPSAIEGIAGIFGIFLGFMLWNVMK